ncbi:efflux RND transporter periplasmic adaptor subunit [Pseudodesulfovibrio sediminis]|uniref:Hemolysin secretion protein D n=1 Tax=Pseudodesulfovibrio sediminis TaxID=2810563 RepID=A0ABM7P5J2_9BACT|nr:efflux RND transporter periplasmic adaptor subunit [Pseudodesulfovibrio sediminis]BCS88125.1 hemolysin secretion protein D [Pseudodesulfovibrio sediminis]
MTIKRLIAVAAAILLVLCAGAGGLSFFVSAPPEDVAALNKSAFASIEDSISAPVMRPIPTAVAELVGNGRSRIFPGKVRGNRRAELSFSVGGKLVALNAQEGSRVQKGQELARLDQRDFINERDAARARFKQAKRNLTKFRSLHKQRVVTQTQFDDIRTAYDIARADLQIEQKALEDTVLRAPFDGVVVNRHIENFGSIKKEEAILSLQDISGIEVVIQVPERLLARDGTDGLTQLQVNFDADPHGDRWFKALIHEYSIESDKTTRTYDVVVALAAPEDLKVFPGMTASVRALIDKKNGSSEKRGAAITRIPVEAIWNGIDGKAYVWVISLQGGHPEKRKVEIGALRGDCAEVVNGLEPGSHVAIAGVQSLQENALVRPQAEGKEGLDG